MDKRVLIAAVGLSAGAFGCRGSGPPTAAVPPEVERTSVVSMSTPPAAPSPTGAPAVRPMPPPPEEHTRAAGAESAARVDALARVEGHDVTVADIDALMSAVSDGARRSARLASTRARDPRVRSFATEMTDERSSEARAKAAGERSALEPPNDTTASLRLRTTTEQSLSALEKQRGRTFDRAYMTFQVTLRRDALEALERDLAPGLRGEEVEARWAEARARLRSERDRAEAIVGDIAPGAPEER